MIGRTTMPHRVNYWACIYCKNPCAEEQEAQVCEDAHTANNDIWFRRYKERK